MRHLMLRTGSTTYLPAYLRNTRVESLGRVHAHAHAVVHHTAPTGAVAVCFVVVVEITTEGRRNIARRKASSISSKNGNSTYSKHNMPSILWTLTYAYNYAPEKGSTTGAADGGVDEKIGEVDCVGGEVLKGVGHCL